MIYRRCMTTLAEIKRAGCPPRFATRRTPSRATLGPRVAEIAEKLGKPFMPWQRDLMNIALELDEHTGLLAYSEVDLVVMRQNGKSESILPLMVHRSMGFTAELVAWVRREYGVWTPNPGPQRTLYLAQTADDARKKWRQIHKTRLELSKYTESAFTATLAPNKEAFNFINGSIWSPGSTTAKTGGTGESLDLGVIDEAWSHKTNRVETALRPTMLTRPWSQLWVVSMVPGLSRVLPNEWGYLRAKIVAGRARVAAGVNEGVCYVEYGAEEGMDPGDPATWWATMPALGHTISEQRIREDYNSWKEAGRIVDFCAEYLSIAPVAGSARWQVIDEPVWMNRIDQVSRPIDPIAIGVASTNERSKTSIGLAARREDGNIHVELLDRIAGVDGAVDVIMELLEDHDICAITVDPAGPEASILDHLRARMANEGYVKPLFTPTLRDMCAASARVYDATGQHDPGGDSSDEPKTWLFHLDQAELNRAVGLAKKDLISDVWRWDFAGATDPLRAITAAWLGGIRSDWSGGGYDIRSSLG